MKKILKLNQMKSTRRKMLGYTGKQNLQRFESRNIFSVEKRMKIIKGWTSKSLKDKKIILPIKTKNLRGGGYDTSDISKKSTVQTAITQRKNLVMSWTQKKFTECKNQHHQGKSNLKERSQ